MTTSEPADEVELPQVGIGGPAAGVLADMASIAGDLTFTRDAALRYAEMAGADGELDDPVVARALWAAAAISYRRAFGSGRALIVSGAARPKLDRDAVASLPELSEEQRDAHSLTILLADKHVAHRVGDQEDARVVALLAPPPAQPRVEGLGLLAIRMVGPEPGVALRLAEVCDFLLSGVNAQVAARRERLLADLVADERPERFYAQSVELD